MSDIVERLKSTSGLPTPPRLAYALLELDPTDDAGVAGMAELSACDPALSAWILKFANSRIMGRGASIATVHEALAQVGYRAGRVVALSQLVVAAHSWRESYNDLYPLWRRSLARSIAAGVIASALDSKRSAEARQSGLLAEVAVLALARNHRGPLASALESLRDPVECISGELLRAWRVPRRVWGPLICMHRPKAVALTNGSLALPDVLRSAAELAAALISDASEPGAPRALYFESAKWRSLFEAARSIWHQKRYLVEPPDDASAAPAEIERRASAALAELSIMTQLENRAMKQRHEELMRRVATDALTGVKNRQAFDERLEEEMERAMRSNRPLTLLLCDLDGFKSFNDRHGHQAGDMLLRAAAEALAAGARRIDVVARYGGEEFAIIAPQCGHEGAASIAERLRRAVKDTTIDWRGETLSTTISIGGAIADGGLRTSSELIEAADRLLYKAKAAGRDCCRIEPIPTVTTSAEAQTAFHHARRA